MKADTQVRSDPEWRMPAKVERILWAFGGVCGILVVLTACSKLSLAIPMAGIACISGYSLAAAVYVAADLVVEEFRLWRRGHRGLS